MSELVSSPRPKRVTQRIVAIAAAFALAPTAGCSTPTEEQLAMQDATRQVFADVLDGIAVNKKPFGDNTFTVSVKDKYPNLDRMDPEKRKWAAFYTYKEGEDRMNTALDLGEVERSEYELRAQAACDTAAVNNMLTPAELEVVQDKWGYYQQLGGAKMLDKGTADDNVFSTITDLDIACMKAVRRGLENGADITFVPAMNK